MILSVTLILVLTTVGTIASGFTGKASGTEKSGSDSINQNESVSSEMRKPYDFTIELDKTMAEIFGIDLIGFRKIDTLPGFIKPEHEELHMGDVREQLNLEYGNTNPSIYLNEDNTYGIAMTQNLQGIYTLYEFEANRNEGSRYKWIITGKKKQSKVNTKQQTKI